MDAVGRGFEGNGITYKYHVRHQGNARCRSAGDNVDSESGQIIPKVLKHAPGPVSIVNPSQRQFDS